MGFCDLAKPVIGILRPGRAGAQGRQIIAPRIQKPVLAAIDIGAIVVGGGHHGRFQGDRGGIVLGGVFQPVLPVEQKPALQQRLCPLVGRQGMGLDGGREIHQGVLGSPQKLMRQPPVQQQPAPLQRGDALLCKRRIGQAPRLGRIADIQGSPDFRDQGFGARCGMGGYGKGRRHQSRHKGLFCSHIPVNPLKLDSNLGAVS